MLKIERRSFFLCQQCQQVSYPIGRKERNRQSMQIPALRGESIRCIEAGAERQGVVERGRGPCREMVQSHADHILWDNALLLLFCPPSSIYGLILMVKALSVHFLFNLFCASASFFFCLFNFFSKYRSDWSLKCLASSPVILIALNDALL